MTTTIPGTYTPTPGASGTSTYTSNTGSTSAKQKMDSEMFLNLLVSQMRNQDPSNAMDTNEMMAQTVQLASMEQLTTMSTLTDENFSLNMRAAAAQLLGKTVEYTGTDGTVKSGTVGSVSYADKVPTVTVDGTAIRLDALLGAHA